MRAVLFTMSLLAMAATAAIAQQTERTPEAQAAPRTPRPAQAPQPPSPPGVPAPVHLGQPVNVKVEVTINDQRGSAPVLKKTVTVVTADGMNGFIRSSANFASIGNVPLNIDVAPQILDDGKIRLRVNLEYDLPASSTAGQGDSQGTGDRTLRVTQIRENLAVIVENNREIVGAQSADPISDRQVTIGIKATILK